MFKLAHRSKSHLPCARAQLRASVATSEKRHIQMIASTWLLIAAKFFDRKLPPLSELVKVHHGQVHAHEFAELELRILDTLRWKLHVPLPQHRGALASPEATSSAAATSARRDVPTGHAGHDHGSASTP